MIRGWAPFAVVLIAYELMRDLASKLQARVGAVRPSHVTASQASVATIMRCPLSKPVVRLYFACPGATVWHQMLPSMRYRSVSVRDQNFAGGSLSVGVLKMSPELKPSPDQRFGTGYRRPRRGDSWRRSDGTRRRRSVGSAFAARRE